MQEAGHRARLCPAAGFCYTVVFRLRGGDLFCCNEREFEHVPKPNTNRGKSAVRSLRVARTRTLRNQSVKSAIKTFVKKTRAAIVGGEEQATEFLQQTASIVDKAAKRGIIHKNAAARRKSRLTKQMNAAKAVASSQ
jgi:small subunit ribosomal protein S20